MLNSLVQLHTHGPNISRLSTKPQTFVQCLRNVFLLSSNIDLNCNEIKTHAEKVGAVQPKQEKAA